MELPINIVYSLQLAVGSSVSGLSGLYTVAMKAAGASRRVFQLLDRVSSMPKSGSKCPLGSVQHLILHSLLSCSSFTFSEEAQVWDRRIIVIFHVEKGAVAFTNISLSYAFKKN